MSTYDVCMNFSGLFVGPLLKEFSYRKVAIAGSLLCALGLALTSSASSVAHILTTFSVINGKLPFSLFYKLLIFDLLENYATFASSLQICFSYYAILDSADKVNFRIDFRSFGMKVSFQ